VLRQTEDTEAGDLYTSHRPRLAWERETWIWKAVLAVLALAGARALRGDAVPVEVHWLRAYYCIAYDALLLTDGILWHLFFMLAALGCSLNFWCAPFMLLDIVLIR
jgi:hypothetical protein